MNNIDEKIGTTLDVVIGHSVCGPDETEDTCKLGIATQEILNHIDELLPEAYKKGHIDGAIEVVNNTCGICHSYPMTTNCNNAGCDN
jgi:hypothetical protein